ncbi:MAG: phosphatidylglycerophosphatase A [bacterium]|nr:phosphatidylglycerophosphatase A [Gammaproteobacteria bacterium]HIL94724.1 phosphatidylglycerophosphatase A [Pseudomonadales bacterium]
MDEKVRKTFTNPWYFLALGGGSGLSRYMPGTMGSLAAIPVYFLLLKLGTWGYGVFVLVAFGCGVWLCDKVSRDMQVKDPASIVWDEFVGMWISLFMLPQGWYWLLIAFGLFRFFDILKPWPIGWLDTNLEGGLGIMVDDVAAGFYSLFIVQVISYVISQP